MTNTTTMQIPNPILALAVELRPLCAAFVGFDELELEGVGWELAVWTVMDGILIAARFVF
jgi:hypothetical protein